MSLVPIMNVVDVPFDPETDYELFQLENLGFPKDALEMAKAWAENGELEAPRLTQTTEREAKLLGLTIREDNPVLREKVENALEMILTKEEAALMGGNPYMLLETKDFAAIALWTLYLGYYKDEDDMRDFLHELKNRLGLIPRSYEDLVTQEMINEAETHQMISEIEETKRHDLYKDSVYDGPSISEEQVSQRAERFMQLEWRAPWGTPAMVRDKEVGEKLKKAGALIKGRLMKLFVGPEAPENYRELIPIRPKEVEIPHAKVVPTEGFIKVAEAVAENLLDPNWNPPAVFVSRLKDGREVAFWQAASSPKGYPVWVQMANIKRVTLGFVSRWGENSPTAAVNALLKAGWSLEKAVPQETGVVALCFKWNKNAPKKSVKLLGRFKNVFKVQEKDFELNFQTRMKPLAFGAAWDKEEATIECGWNKTMGVAFVPAEGAKWIRIDVYLKRETS